ncbi:MAG: HEAT repeat domain-containing protein [Planctomycetota bacterium]
MYRILVLAIWLSSLGHAAPIAQTDDVSPAEFREIEQAFTSASRDDLDGWLAKMEKVRSVDDERAVDLLGQALEDIEQSVNTLGRQYERVVEELTPLQRINHTPTERKKYDDLNATRKELGDILDRERRAATAIEAAFAGMTGESAREALVREARRSKSWRMRAAALNAIGSWEQRPGDAIEALIEAVEREKDPKVRVIALEAAGRTGEVALVDPVSELLEDKFPEVAKSAAQALGEIGSKDAVPALIKAMKKVSGNDAVAIQEALTKLTGANLGENAKDWERWWKDTGSTGDASRLPPSQGHKVKKKGVISYYGIETTSERVLFIIDISDSMNDSALQDALPEDGSQPNREGNARSKLSVAKDELVKAIVGLSEDSTFNMIFYNHTVSAWQPRMVAANKKNKNEALEKILGVKAEGATNIFEALELGFSMAGMGLSDRYYPAAIDTIFFLTDGEPTAGRLQEKPAILEEIERQNRYKKVELHCIGMGILHDRNFLQSLARQNAGQYVALK